MRAIAVPRPADGRVARRLEIVDLGRTDHESADRVQKEALAARIAGGPDRAIFCELDAVITLGRGTKPGAVVDRRWPVFEVERGGEATLHLPGQLVVYPVVGLEARHRDLPRWVWQLEGIVLGVLSDFGIEGRRRDGLRGVWVEGIFGWGKIASVGVAFRRWTSYHGFSLNVAPDLDLFGAIRPCGFDPAVMTSMECLLGSAPSWSKVVERTMSRVRQIER
jgi:lipoate-protein ligase B